MLSKSDGNHLEAVSASPKPRRPQPARALEAQGADYNSRRAARGTGGKPATSAPRSAGAAASRRVTGSAVAVAGRRSPSEGEFAAVGGGGDPGLDQPRRGGVPGSVGSGGGRQRAGPRGARC